MIIHGCIYIILLLSAYLLNHIHKYVFAISEISILILIIGLFFKIASADSS